ncbi:MAG: ATP-dependent helicase [Actinobacteria bacterium]|nr:ATP-dependent helicase [Actinomycetota bacterium]
MSGTRTAVESVLGHDLSDEQWQAVSSPAEPSAIVAGAGSGKTTVMSACVLWLVLEGMALPDEILGLTFTAKAAGELLTRTRRLLLRADRQGLLPDGLSDSGAVEPAISTYHSFASRLLRDHGVRLGLEPDAEVLADGARQALAARVVRATSLPLAELGRSPATLVDAVLTFDDALAELDLDPERALEHSVGLIGWLESLPSLQEIGRDMLDTARVRAALCGLVTEFREAKLDAHAIDFADQVRLALSIVRAAPEVAEELRLRYPFVLLDEYQDTSAAQRVLLQQVFADGHPVTAVGDPCQAIYEWRGASVANIDHFPRHFPRRAGAGPAPRYPLVDNRRSAPRILDLANEIAGPLRAVHPGVDPLRAAATEHGRGEVVVALHSTHAEEVDWVCDRVAEIAAHQGQWEGIAVLARTSATLVDVDAALRRRGIPTRLVGAAGLLQVPVVAELRAVLEVIDDPAADPALVRLLTGARWRLGPRDLAALGSMSPRAHRDDLESVDLAAALRAAVLGSDPVDRPSLAETVESAIARAEASGLSAVAITRLTRLTEEIRRLRRHVDEPCVDLISRVLRTTGLGVEASMGPDAADNARALADFRELAARMTRGGGGLSAFLARLREAEHYDESPRRDDVPSGDAVLLMTAHRAKGLEFAHVVLPGMCRSVFPSGRGRDRWPTNAAVVPWDLHPDAPPPLSAFPDRGQEPRAKDHRDFVARSADAEMLEERRLAYVAVTRAERTLTVSGHWWGPSQRRTRGPGAFLEEVHAWCEGNGGVIDVWAPEPPAGATNPAMDDRATPWPPPPDPQRARILREVAHEVRAARALTPAEEDLLLDDDRSRVESWDAEIGRLLEEARRARAPLAVRVPDDLSTTALMRLAEDPEAFARELARPMPRRPHPAARLGTDLHAWIEGQYAVQTLFDLEELDAADDLDDDLDLAALREAFRRTPYASRAPVAVEEPFALAIGGRVVRGRIDAVFGTADGHMEVVDWKSGGRGGLSDLQLAIYRLAWAEIAGIPVERIDAAFVLVRTGEVIRPQSLLDRADVERLLNGR